MKKIDMSSDAITRRLRQTEQLRVLCLSLMKAEKIPEAKFKEQDKKDDRNNKK